MFSRNRYRLRTQEGNRPRRSTEPLWTLLATKTSRVIRALGPALLALSFAGAAHAQGTMDFSGAQTLMGTFNVSTAGIQAKIVVPDALKIVPEEPVSTIERQRENIRHFEYRVQRRVIFGAEQI